MTRVLTQILRLGLLSLLAITPLVSAENTDATIKIKPYIAKYSLLRSGKEHGSAERELFVLNTRYRLRYESSLEWMVFSDQRSETSEFMIVDNQVKPLSYKMDRKGTGPDRSYQVTFDRENRQIKGPKQRRKKRKKDKKDKKAGITWNENWLDPISYQQQLYIDLHQGKTEFHYKFINRKGQEHQYRFKVTDKETLVLPYGTVKALKVERIHDNSERQTIAWFAPELDYALVRIWKGKSGVEQFDIRLKELVW